MNKIKLSIVIVSYNTVELTLACIKALEDVRNEVPFEIIVVDNGSTDSSVEEIRKFQIPKLKFQVITNTENIGFGRANNQARDIAKGEYILFLNSDTLVHKSALKETVQYLDDHEDVGSITCKLTLPSGKLDKDTRRSFPTPWVAFTHLVLPLDRLFPKSITFSKYWYGYISDDEVHEVDAIQGAYHLTRRIILDKVGWFDEDYFLDGEDIDLCYRIKEAGWKIIYYPKVNTTHVKKASKKTNDKEKRKKFVRAGADAMELFYRKRLWNKYPKFFSYVILLGVRIVKYVRLTKLSLSK